MRLARPIYESMPIVYAAIGGIAFLVANFDSDSRRATAALTIGLIAEIAALTVFLRRQDCRALSREYSGERVELPTNSNI
jgi:hypothetical protein